MRANARAEAAVVALDERDHVAVVVGGGEIDGVALVGRRVAGGVLFAARAGSISLRRSSAYLAESSSGNRRLLKCGVGVEPGPVLERELLGLDEPVQVVGTAEAGSAEVVPLEDLQHLQRGDALAVGRQLPHVVTAVVERSRVRPTRCGVRRGRRREEPAGVAHVGLDRAGDVAAIEGVATAAGDLLERVGEARVAKRFAVPRRLAVRQERVGEAREFATLGEPAAPAAGDDLGDGKAIAGRGESLGPAVAPAAACRSAGEARPSRRRSPARSLRAARPVASSLRPRRWNSSSVRLRGLRPLAFRP